MHIFKQIYKNLKKSMNNYKKPNKNIKNYSLKDCLMGAAGKLSCNCNSKVLTFEDPAHRCLAANNQP